MNKIYRLIWSGLTWVAVSEITRGRGKRASSIVSASGIIGHSARFIIKPLAFALVTIGVAHAAPAPPQLPTGGQIVAGSASIAQNNAAMNITQSTQRASINWQTFNVGSAAQVNFLQPSSISVTLNRVLDSNPSQIFGRINANGQVFFTNPNGMYFAPGASVDVGGLVATTHSISDADFMAGNYVFNRNGATGSIVNDGNLTASLGGYIALLAPEVRNNGMIVAQMGTVALAAGESYTLQFDGNNTLADIAVTPASIKALVENGNAVQAPGGLIILSAQAADRLQGGVINNSGSLEATGLVNNGGVIRLEAGNGQTTVSGTLDASSINSNGGQIVVTGQQVRVGDGAKIVATGATGGGTINIGGGLQGGGGILQATTVTMQQSATIDASATQQGDGGKVVLWAEGTTDFAGSIIAKGAGQGGSGGSAEVSGKTQLNYTGHANLLGGQGGQTGTLLLDPYDLYITTGSGGSVTASGNNSILGVSTLTSQLTTANVVVSTGSSGTQSGIIGVLTDITSASTHNLTLTAASNVVLDGNVNMGGLFTVNAGGNFVMGTNLSTATGVTITANDGFVKTGSGTNFLTGNITTSGAAINIAGPVQIANFNGGSNPLTLTTAGGNITIGGAVSNYSGTAQNYATVMASNLYDGVTASAVTGSSTDVYVSYNEAGGNLFLGQTGMSNVNYLLVGGGGGSGGGVNGNYSGGGGGGGGVYGSTMSVSAGSSYSITVGSGGTAGNGPASNGSNGGDTGFGNIWVGGGGGGGASGNASVSPLPGVVGYGNNNLAVAGRSYSAGGGGGGGGGSSIAGREPAGAGGTGSGVNGAEGQAGNLGCTNCGGLGGGSSGANGWATGVSSSITGVAITYGVGGTGGGTAAGLGGSGANYSSPVNSNAGTAIISYTVGNASTSAASALKFNAGSGSVTLGSSVSNLSSLEINAGSASSIAGAISGTGTLTNSGAGALSITGAATYTGSTAVTSSSIIFTNDSPSTTSGFTGAGSIIIQPGSTSFTSTFTPSYSYAPTLTGLTLGKAGNTANITVGSATSLAGPINIYGGNITLNAGLTATGNNTITLAASGYATEGGSGNISATNLLLDGTGSYTFGTATVGTLAATGVRNLSLTNSALLSIGTVLSTNGISASGTVSVATTSGNLTVSQNVATTNTTNSALVLDAGTSDAVGTTVDNIVLSGSPTVTVGTGGRAILYTGSVSGSTGVTGLVGSGSGDFRYDSKAGTSNFTAVLGSSGTYAVYREQPTLTITANNPIAITYGGTMPTFSSTVTGEVNGDTQSTALTTQGIVADDGVYSSTGILTAGTHTLTASGAAGQGQRGYAVSYATGSLIVNKAVLTVSSTTVANKTYDGTTTATLGSGTLVGVIPADSLNVSLTQAGTFASQNVGTAVSVTASDSLSGSAMRNYTLTEPTGLNAAITAKPVTLIGTMTYNGSTSVPYTVLTVSNAISGAPVSVSNGIAALASSNAGSENLTSASLGNLSLSNSNYTLTGASGSVTVSKLPVTLTGTAIYNGTTTVANTALTVTNAVGSDVVTINSGTGTLAGKNVGSEAISSLGSLTVSNSNYTITGATGSVTVTPLAVTLTAPTTSKTYDGTTSDIATAANLAALSSALVGGDTLTGITLTYANKNAGSGNKTVMPSAASISGGDAIDYTITYAANNVSTILPLAVTLNGSTSVIKTYDGATSMPLGVTGYNALTGTISGDSIQVSGSPVYSSANAGSPSVMQGSTVLTGADAGNYTLSWVNGSGTINKAALTMTANNAAAVLTASDPTFTASYSGFVAGQTAATAAGLTASFTRTAGESAGNYTITPSGTATNYTITPVTGVFTIVPANELLISVNNASSVYGSALPAFSTLGAEYYSSSGSALRTVTLTSTGGGNYTYTDGLGTAGSFNLSTAATSTSGVGNYAVTVSNFTKTGSNFTSEVTQNGVLSVSQRAATLSANPFSMVYNGTTAIAGATASISNLVGSDTVSVIGSGSFNSGKNVGTNLSYTLNSLQLTGLETADYYIASPTLTASNGTITARPLNWSVNNASSTYGTTAMPGTATLINAIAGDVLTDTVTVYNTGAATVVSPATRTAAGTYDEKVTAIGGADAGNYTLSGNGNTVGTLTISPKAITLTPDAISKTYDQTTAYTTQASDLTAIASSAGIVTGDSLTGISLAYADANAGSSKTVQASSATISNGSSSSALSNYTITYASSQNGIITPLTISVGATPTANNKVYDGLTNATLSSAGSLSGVLNGDTVSLGSVGNFVDPNAGTGKTVNLSYLLSGSSAGNYSLSSYNGTTTANITPAPLTMTANNAAKLLTETDPIFTASYSGFVNGETATVLTNPTVTRNNVGTEAAATYTGVLVPSATSNNYTITPVDGNFTIVPAQTLLIQLANQSMVYGSSVPALNASEITSVRYLAVDGSTIVSITPTCTGSSCSGNDGLGETFTFNLTTATTSASKVNNYSIGVSGFNITGGSNFSTEQFQNGNLAVTPVAVTPAATVSKIYDGATATAGATLSVSNNVSGSDAVTLSGVGAYASKNAGSNLTYTFSNLALSGSDAYNYYLSPSLTSGGYTASNGAILALPLSVTFTGVNKVYNGTTAATVTATTSNVVSGDSLSVSELAAFTNVNAGTGKTINVSGVTLSGADAGNYSVASTGTATANITAAPLTLTTSAVAKTYDGTLTAAGAAIVDPNSGTQLYSTDNLSGGTFAFTNANAGTGKTVTATGVTVNDGNSGGNYMVTYDNNVNSIINPKSVTLTAPVVSKTYDGLTAYTANAANLSTLSAELGVNGDAVSAATLSYADSHASTGKTATISALTVSDPNNYNLSYASNTTSVITPATLTATLTNTGVTKIYDGTTVAPAGFTPIWTIGGLVGADTVTVSVGGAQLYNNANVVGATQVTVSGLSLGGISSNYGSLASDYTLPGSASVTANITPKALTATVAAPNKVYDGTATATPTLTITNGLVGTETVTATGTATFNTKDVSTANLVTVNNDALANGTNGGLASNYSLANGETVVASITPAPLTTTVTAPNKIYNGTTTATPTLTITGGLVGSETVTATGTATFNTKDVSTANLVTVNNDALANGTNGGLASNYSLATGETVAASIMPKPLTVTASNASKTSDGVAYSGGNGVIYTGFVNSETDTVLGGTLGYAGSSQGAIYAGSYTITPQGLTSGNYQISFADGTLTIHPAPPPPPPSTSTPSIPTSAPPLGGSSGGSGSVADTSSLSVVGSSASSSGGGNSGGNNFNSGGLIISGGSTSSGSGNSSGSNTSSSSNGSSSGLISSSNSSSTSSNSGSSGSAANAGSSSSTSQVTGGSDSSFGGGDNGTTGATGVPGSGGISISLVRQPSLQQAGIITVSVPKDMATTGSGFSFPLPAQVTSTGTGSNAVINVTTANGQPLPSWLKFNLETKTFVASAVPDGAFPMQVRVTVDGRSTTIVISERNQ